MTSAIVPCAPAIEGELLWFEGRPVWPIRDDGEALALRRMTELMGGRLAVVDATTTAPPALDLERRVVALGPGLQEEARLYAHLTGRRDGGIVRDAAEVIGLGNVDVIVTLREHIDDALLERLYSGDEDRPAVGLVFAEDASKLRVQVLARSAAAVIATPIAIRRLDMVASAGVAVTDIAPDWRLVGGKSSAPAVRDALADAVGVLSVVTHSNGVDAFLSEEVVLCPMDQDVGDAWDRALAPTCKTNGYCFRKKVDIREALASGQLLAPSELRARVLVAGICFGLRPPPSTNAPLWSLSRRFVEDLRVGALVAGWEIVTGTHLATDVLTADLSAGEAVGIALGRHNRRQAADRLFRMALVGDPRCTPSTRAPRLELATISVPPDDATLATTRFAQLGFLRALATLAPAEREGGARGEGADDRAPVLAALARYELALLRQAPLEGGDDAPGPAMRTAMLDFLAARWTNPTGVATALRGRIHVQPTERCSYCDRSLQVLHVDHVLPIAARRVALCANCGIVEDVPVGRRLVLDLDVGPVVRPRGDLPVRAADVRFVLDVPMARYRRTFAWPAGEGGAAEPELACREAWSATPCRAALLVLWPTGELGVAGRFVRGEAWNAPRGPDGPARRSDCTPVTSEVWK